MKVTCPMATAVLAISAVMGCARAPMTHLGNRDVPANVALTGVPLEMTPDQLPYQFRIQLRDDAAHSRGKAVLNQHGADVEYTFSWDNVTSPVISGHFHKAPHGQVGVRAYSICGVPNESPTCPTGAKGSLTGVWKNADLEAFRNGEITIAFHTKVYPAPIGEIAAYIPPAQGEYKN